MTIEIARGDIVLVDLSGAIGGEKKNAEDERPRSCIVVQNDRGNRGSPLTIVAPLNDARQNKGYAEHVAVSADELGPGGKDSIVECGHLRSIDRSRIVRRLGALAPETMERVSEGLRSSLAL